MVHTVIYSILEMDRDGHERQGVGLTFHWILVELNKIF